MVLEEIYSLELLKKKKIYAFLLGIAYSVIGLGGAIFLFPDDPALVAVALISLMMLPYFRKFSELEEKEEKAQPSFLKLLKYNKDTFSIILLLFLGSFLVFAFFAIMLPSLAANHLFQNQLQVLYNQVTGGSSGGAYFTSGLFFELFNNNLKVLIFCFIVSILVGGGSIFIIIWNASLWGTIFGMLAKTAALTTGKNPWIIIGLIFLSVFPHMILEVSSYIASSIAGSVSSVTFLKEKFLSKQFKDKMMINLYLFVIAVFILVVAMMIETYVLNNFQTYQLIIQKAFG